MSHQLFLSHDHRDSQIAKTMASLISRITLNQLTVWHSSDPAGEGGMRPGHVWLDEIRSRLQASRAVIPLVTPNSISRPWLLFESGFGAAIEECEVVPICIGIDRLDEVPFPLAMYQCYLLSDYESLKAFCVKLFRRYEICFDDDMSKSIIKKCIGQLVKHKWDSGNGSKSATIDIAAMSDDIKNHIDRRFLDFFNIPAGRTFRTDDLGDFVPYSVPVFLDFPELKNIQLLKIGENTTIQHVTNAICSMILDYVGNYTYLEKWIIRNSKSNKRLVIREFQSKILAHPIFRPGTEWIASSLTRPYRGTDSSIDSSSMDD